MSTVTPPGPAGLALSLDADTPGPGAHPVRHARTLPPRFKRKACDAACRRPGVGLRRACCRLVLPHHCDVAVHPPRRPANDAFERRQMVPTVPVVLFGDTSLCTLQPGEPPGLGAAAVPGTKGAVGFVQVAGADAAVGAVTLSVLGPAANDAFRARLPLPGATTFDAPVTVTALVLTTTTEVGEPVPLGATGRLRAGCHCCFPYLPSLPLCCLPSSSL